MYEKRFFTESLVHKKTLNNIIGIIEFEGIVQLDLLEKILDHVFNDFYNITNSYYLNTGIRKNKEARVKIEWYDRSKTSPNKIIRALKVFNFDLKSGPLSKVKIIESNKKIFVIFCFPHIICDAVSGKRVLEAIINSYKNSTEGIHPDITPYLSEYSLSKQNYSNYEADKFYWDSLLKKTNTINRLISPLSLHHELFFKLNKSTSLRLKKLAKNLATTPFILMATIFSIFISKIMALDYFFILYPVNMRKYYKVDLAGAHINMVPMLITLNQNPSFIEIIKSLTQQRKETKPHEQFPFDEIAKLATSQFKITPKNIFPFTLGESHVAQQNTHLKNAIIRYQTMYGANFSAINLLYNINENIYAKLCFNNLLFSKMQSKIFTNIFKNIVETLLANPDQPISSTPLLSEKDYQKTIYGWNQTQKPIARFKPLHVIFEEQARKNPNNIALEFNSKRITYQELNKNANKLAHAILARLPSNTHNPVIPIYTERSFEMVIGILAILKIGGAYLPINTEWPEHMIMEALSEIDPIVILSQERFSSKFNSNKVISLNQDYSDHPDTNPQIDISPNDLAYIIYTSGSTGLPKGSLVSHQNFHHSISARLSFYGSGRVNFVLIPPFYFDSSIAVIFWTLSTGGKLLIPKDIEINALKSLVLDTPELYFLSTPTIYQAFLDSCNKENLKNIRSVIIAGESFSKNLIAKHFRKSNATLYNEYGPTEATIWSTAYQIKKRDKKIIPIGRPITNTTCYILDEYMNPVPIGVTGELYIGGMGVAQGYLNRPDLTAERFLPNPFVTEEEKQEGYNTRIYKTGDLVRWLPDGNIEYIGRADFQVKIRGLRIELGEIEATLLKYPGIQQAVVIVKGEDENKQLVAYYVSNKGEISPTDLQAFLGQNLPDYMVPAFFMALKEMPLNANGKIDRKALPEVNLTQIETNQPPQTLTEAKLAKLWAKALNLKNISRSANFFHLGGHSLAAIKLVYEINQTFGTDYAASFVFDHKTLLEQATMLDKGRKRKKYQAIMPLNQAAENFTAGQIPLVFVHPGQGGIEMYTELVAKLPAELPIFGIDSYNLYHKKPITSMQKLANYYVKALHQAIPSETYILGGWSLGGCLAFAMAEQMAASLTRIPLLMMMDSFTTRHIADDLVETFFEAAKQARIYEYQKEGLPQSEIDKRTNLLELENRMIHEFQPKRYAGKTLFINAIQTDSYAPLFQVFPHLEPHFSQLKQSLNGWQAYLPHVKSCAIDFDHYELTQGQGLIEVSNILNQALNKTSDKKAALVD